MAGPMVGMTAALWALKLAGRMVMWLDEKLDHLSAGLMAPPKDLLMAVLKVRTLAALLVNWSVVQMAVPLVHLMVVQ